MLIDREQADSIVKDLVLSEYDLHPQTTAAYGCVTKLVCPQGAYALKETKVTAKQLQLLAGWFDKLAQEESAPVVPFYPNKFGDPFVDYLNRLYYVTPWLDDDIEAKYRLDWEPSVLTALGRLHRFTLTVTPAVQKHLEALTRVKIRWLKQLRRMEYYQRRAEAKPLFSPFEGSFLHAFDYLYQCAVRSIRYLEAWIKRGAGLKHWPLVLCHGRPARSHVVFRKGKCYIINFDRSKMAHPVMDLALFFRRHLVPSLHVRAGYGMNWMAAYENQFPLGRFDKGLLAILLLFPERLFTEVEAYYQGKKDLSPLKRLHRFRKELDRFNTLRTFARALLATTASQSAGRE
ncbi:spore coat protein YsxE [Caldalkalibacillus uzonensis]|uniref:Spore coat protein YsxE n=1 Tax=Caldalkalibacillus uzonensis TaxID=353224 RepID=A0ABU0CWR5_9BACI|nr:phosphotransferase [Caldalkalibacillus uzonensis]MDQ0339482.1 spore coat protein YsxE [Caldalkalibacillus uzonensis]